MNVDNSLHSQADSLGDRLCPHLVKASVDCERLSDFHAAASKILREILRAPAAMVIEGTKGQWRVRGGSPIADPLPLELLAESLDRHQPLTAKNWTVAPLSLAADNKYLLAVQSAEKESPLKLAQLESVAHFIHLIGQIVSQRSIAIRRAQRLRSMLEMTTRWNQSRETEALLEEMAHTSLQLLEAQRATIFLWDKANRQLIGKPALGVAGGEIRVPENVGVVGQVIASGQPQRVDSDVAPEQAQIHRSIDQQLGFQTRSLLCVPMFDTEGRVVGAFELINKSTGSFTDDDLAALTE